MDLERSSTRCADAHHKPKLRRFALDREHPEQFGIVTSRACPRTRHLFGARHQKKQRGKGVAQYVAPVDQTRTDHQERGTGNQPAATVVELGEVYRFFPGRIRRRGRPRGNACVPEAFAANMAVVRAVQQIAVGKGLTAAQLALAWVQSRGEDIVPIPGTRNAGRLAENVAAVERHVERPRPR